MSKAIRITLSLVFSLMLLSALTMAQTGGNTADKDKSKEHHSGLAKVAFWRHHNDADKNTKPAQATPTPSKQAQVKTAQPKTAQVKPVSTGHVANKSDQKPEHHASNTSKPALKKAAPATKTKPQHKVKDPKAASVKQ